MITTILCLITHLIYARTKTRLYYNGCEELMGNPDTCSHCLLSPGKLRDATMR